MIELTTNIAFLLSSMYGTSNVHVVMPQETATIQEITVTTDASTTVALKLSKEDIKDVEAYIKQTFAHDPLLIEIARCESTFVHYRKNGEVVRGNVNKADVGVMQINEKYHLEQSIKLGLDIHTVKGNVAYAKKLYDEQGAQPWSASSPCWSKSVVAKNQIAQNK